MIYIRDVFTYLEDTEGYDFDYHIYFCKNYNLDPDPNDSPIPHYICLFEKSRDLINPMSRDTFTPDYFLSRLQELETQNKRMKGIYSIIDKLIDQVKDKCEFSRIERSYMASNIYVNFYYQ